MSLLDRYLLRQYVQVLLICFCSLIGLYAVIDAIGHLDQFTTYARQTNESTLAVIGRYYAFQSIGFFDRTSGILAMMAAMFTMAWFKRHNELTAVMAAGISQLRAAMPLLVAGGVISILAATSREVVLPAIRSQLLRSTNDLAGTTEKPLRSWYDATSDMRLQGEATIAEGRRIIKPKIRLPSKLDLAVDEVSAAEARYLDATPQYPAGFLFLELQPDATLQEEPSIRMDGRTVLYSRSDTPWLAREGGQLFWPTDVDFDQLSSGSNWRNFASTAELVRFVQRPSNVVPSAAYVTMHGRLVRPILDVSLVVIGLPLVLSRRGRSPFLAVGLAMALVVAFLIVALTCEFLGSRGWIGPSLAAWLPLFLFVPLAVASSDVLRR